MSYHQQAMRLRRLLPPSEPRRPVDAYRSASGDGGFDRALKGITSWRQFVIQPRGGATGDGAAAVTGPIFSVLVAIGMGIYNAFALPAYVIGSEVDPSLMEFADALATMPMIYWLGSEIADAESIGLVEPRLGWFLTFASFNCCGDSLGPALPGFRLPLRPLHRAIALLRGRVQCTRARWL